MSPVDPHLFVIFGATGDLTRRKLIPSIYRVMTENDVAGAHNLLGVARRDLSDSQFRQFVAGALHRAGHDGVPVDEWCRQRVFYERNPEGAPDLDAIAQRIEEIESELDLPGNRIFYLALPPRAFGPTIEQLGSAGLAQGPGWTRLVVEKPFGRDLASARALNETIHRWFNEEQVYRIDHYLGKETVQNLLAFRFANLLFESSWNRDRVEALEITVAETLGVEGRAGYYDKSGVVRDMVQNHVAQLISLVTMEAPHRFAADAIRSEKVDALQAVRPVDVAQVVFGQYAAGTIAGETVPAYSADPDVSDGSATPTYVAMRLDVGNWRWEGVPIYVRTGKRLPQKMTQIAVRFRRPPICIFHGVEDDCAAHQNVVVLSLQPHEGFEIHFDVKAPGSPLQLESQPLHFDYAEVFHSLPDAYQTLLLDVMEGDQMLFVRVDEVEASWELFEPLLRADIPVLPYAAGTWGPDGVESKLGMAGNWIV